MTFIAASIDLLKSLIKPKKVAPHEVASMLESIHGALLSMNRKESVPEQAMASPPSIEVSPGIMPVPPLPEERIPEPVSNMSEPSLEAETEQSTHIPNNGVSEDGITCLICGQTRKILVRHLRSEHGMDEQVYRQQFSLDESFPLIAPSHARRLTAMGQQRQAKNRRVAEVTEQVVEAVPAKAPSHASDPATGITDEAITCLVCGESRKRLREHLRMEHQLDEEAYRRRFNLPESLPLVAPALSRKMAVISRARHSAARLAKEQQANGEAVA